MARRVFQRRSDWHRFHGRSVSGSAAKRDFHLFLTFYNLSSLLAASPMLPYLFPLSHNVYLVRHMPRDKRGTTSPTTRHLPGYCYFYTRDTIRVTPLSLSRLIPVLYHIEPRNQASERKKVHGNRPRTSKNTISSTPYKAQKNTLFTHFLHCFDHNPCTDSYKTLPQLDKGTKTP